MMKEMTEDFLKWMRFKEKFYLLLIFNESPNYEDSHFL